MWSFDIFDTCLVRQCAFPSDLFLDLAERLKDQLEPALGPDFREVFREARMDANRLALKRHSAEEVTLQEIWEELVLLIPALSVSEGMSLELAQESAGLRPIPQALELVKQGRNQFSRVAFISDTYLPGEFIRQQLAHHGFWEVGDELILSNESRTTKHSGRLFQTALKQLGVPAASLKHHGDNVHSDVSMAAAAGISAKHLPAGALSTHECKVGARLKHLDGAITATLLGNMRSGRLSHPAADPQARALVSSFIGPFLESFAQWLLQRASKDGIQRLYFFSRDCYALHRVATALAAKLKLNIECRYLKVSRQALLLPASTEISAEGMPWLRRTWEQGDLGAILAKMELDCPEAYAALRELDGGCSPTSVLRSDQQWEQFWQLLRAEPLRGMLESRIHKRREAAFAYFRREGLLGPEKSAMVDVGWLQSGHAALVKLLQMEKPECRLPGYYLGLNSGRGNNIRGCAAQALYHQAPYDRRTAGFRDEVFHRVHLLEHVLNCAPHGSISHYEFKNNEVEAVERPCAAAEKQTKQELASAVEHYVCETRHLPAFTDSEARDILSALLDVTASEPDGRWAKLLQNIEVSNDQNNRDAASLVRARSLPTAIKDGLRGQTFNSLPVHQKGYWPEMSLAASTQGAQRIYKAIDIIQRGKTLVFR